MWACSRLHSIVWAELKGHETISDWSSFIFRGTKTQYFSTFSIAQRQKECGTSFTSSSSLEMEYKKLSKNKYQKKIR